jgi:hypothetical protein
MANVIKEQKLIDNQRRALLKYVYVSDGTQSANTVLVDVSNLAYSLNANGKIMSSNTHIKGSYRTTIQRLWGYISINSGYVKLQWHGIGAGGNTEIALLKGTGPFSLNPSDQTGLSLVIGNPETDLANTTGDIVISSFGPTANDVATFFIDLKKDALDFDAGQTSDPSAFNR